MRSAAVRVTRFTGQGRICLPARSFRGALRSQAERILRTLGHRCCGPGTGPPCEAVRKIEDVEKRCLACQVFGATGWRSPLPSRSFRQKAPFPMNYPGRNSWP
ncbi:MAG: RAMP superfamily CRISPR-associated protein [Gammaproteobacteria bacterium]